MKVKRGQTYVVRYKEKRGKRIIIHKLTGRLVTITPMARGQALVFEYGSRKWDELRGERRSRQYGSKCLFTSEILTMKQAKGVEQ